MIYGIVAYLASEFKLKGDADSNFLLLVHFSQIKFYYYLCERLRDVKSTEYQ